MALTVIVVTVVSAMLCCCCRGIVIGYLIYRSYNRSKGELQRRPNPIEGVWQELRGWPQKQMLGGAL